VVSRDVPLTARAVGERLEPGLMARANEVREVRITGPGKAKVTIRAEGDLWRVVEKGGYPAKPAEVRKLVLQLANLELVEAKTALPERLPRLELEDPGAEAAKSRRIELLGEGGAPIAAAVVGKTRFGLYGGGRSGVYVRRPDAPQAWLTAGGLELPTDALDLVDMQVIDVPVAEVARVTLGVGQEAIRVHRPQTGDQNFTVEAPVPAGRELDPAKVEEVAGMLAAVSLQDVKPAAELALPPDARRSRVETFDGLAVDVTVARVGEGEGAEHWVQLAAAAVAPTVPPAPASPAPPSTLPEAAAAAPAEEAAATAPPAAAKPAATSPAARAEELNGRLKGWAFKVQPYLGERLGASLEALLAEKEPPAS
jgi:hypothetical protein